MQTTAELRLRLMTYNIGQGRKDFRSVFGDILQIIQDTKPDLLVLQEVIETRNMDNVETSYARIIMQECQFAHFYFGQTLSMSEHMHTGKIQFVQALFEDYVEWQQGNAIFSRSRFVRLGDESKEGTPWNIPIYRPPVYEGNRDTDPRYALLARIDHAPFFPLVIGTHLTTLLGERGGQIRELPGKSEEAQLARFRQAQRLLDLIRRHQSNEIVFLLGDLNAVASEPCIASVLEKEGGFFRLKPRESRSTHLFKVAEAVDHIFVYPEHRLVNYECRIIDNEMAQRASDHLPVVADVVIQ